MKRILAIIFGNQELIPARDSWSNLRNPHPDNIPLTNDERLRIEKQYLKLYSGESIITKMTMTIPAITKRPPPPQPAIPKCKYCGCFSKENKCINCGASR